MPFISLTPEEERHVLSVLGLQSVNDIYSSIPPKLRENADFKLEGAERGMSEQELHRYFSGLAERNGLPHEGCHFLGGGHYDSPVPAIVDSLAQRGEFLTPPSLSFPEAAQGSLQVLFEFQTLLCRITAMPVAQAVVDSATALQEALRIAERRRASTSPRVFSAGSIGPETREVMHSFSSAREVSVLSIPWKEDGTVDLVKLKARAAESDGPSAFVVASPNYFGVIEPLDKIREALPKDCLLIVLSFDPSAFSIFEPPGVLGADIVVGDMREFGMPLLFGGSSVGFIAATRDWLGEMPGPFVAETFDNRGRRGYTPTLLKENRGASSLFLTQASSALRAAVYLSTLGKTGFLKFGEWNYSLFDYLVGELEGHGIPLRFKEPLYYREGVFEIPNLDSRFVKALEAGIVPGISLAPRFGADFSNCLLVAVSPKHQKANVDALVEALSHG